MFDVLIPVSRTTTLKAQLQELKDHKRAFQVRIKLCVLRSQNSNFVNLGGPEYRSLMASGVTHSSKAYLRPVWHSPDSPS